MLLRRFHWILLSAVLAGCSSIPPQPTLADLQKQVINTETAFAKTMANRDLLAFSQFISEEAVFFSGDKALRGKAAIVAAWQPLFNGSAAPFAWQPSHVEVLDSGQLALSTGPVTNAAGENVAMFSSIWRREPSGQWQIIFDKGSDVCRCLSGQQ